LRIAIVTQGFSIGGGVPTIAKWLRTELSAIGHEVNVHDLATSWTDERSRRLLDPASWLVSLAPDPHPTDAWLIRWGANFPEFEGQRYRARRSLTDALNEYDIIQVVSGAATLALSVANAVPPKVLQVATDITSERSARLAGMPIARRVLKTMGLPTLRRLERLGLRSVDEVLVENRGMEGFVRSAGQASVVFAPPGIDLGLFGPAGAWESWKPVVAMGRLGDSRKDWPTAVAAYELFIANTDATNELVIAGRGPASAELLRKIDESPLRERIRLLEDVPAAELPALLASGSVFLQSSLEEGLGLAGLEAMACGLPVVATRTAGSSEYVRDGANGYLVDINSDTAGALADRLSQTLLDGRGSTLSQGALDMCRTHFSSEVALHRFVDVYRRLTN
jgi:glycosyltransferase involved in cell wall biosynthesis